MYRMRFLVSSIAVCVHFTSADELCVVDTPRGLDFAERQSRPLFLSLRAPACTSLRPGPPGGRLSADLLRPVIRARRGPYRHVAVHLYGKMKDVGVGKFVGPRGATMKKGNDVACLKSRAAVRYRRADELSKAFAQPRRF